MPAIFFENDEFFFQYEEMLLESDRGRRVIPVTDALQVAAAVWEPLIKIRLLFSVLTKRVS